jgi:ABC-type antimicrobial peptide transport system permease subunit
VITHIVGQRRAELAIRLALGAERSTVLTMILRKAVLVSALGAAIGLGLSFAGARAAGSLLYGISPFDWPSFGVSGLLAIGVGLVAALAPALRATNVDAADSLRVR